MPDPRFRSPTAVAGMSTISSVFKRLLSNKEYHGVDQELTIIGIEPTEDYDPPGMGKRLDPLFDLGVLVPVACGKPQGEFSILYMMDRAVGVSVTMHPIIENVTKSIECIAIDFHENPEKYTPDQIKGVMEVGHVLIKEITDHGTSSLTAKAKIPILLTRTDDFTFKVLAKAEFTHTKLPTGPLVIYASATEKRDVR